MVNLPMQYKVGEIVKNLNGKPIKDGDTKKDLTFARVFEMALLSDNEKERKRDRKAKIDMFRIATKIHGANTCELSAEEVVLIKEVVSDVYIKLIIGRVEEFFEGK